MSTLLTAVSNSDTVFSITPDPSLPLVDGVLLVESEQIIYTSYYMGTLYGCQRGSNGTSAASHAIGVAVTLLSYFSTQTGEPGVFTTVTISGLTASTALTANASKVVASSTTTSTELGYVHGVTSALQTQLDGKLSLGGGTVTGTLDVQTLLKGHGTITNDNAATGYIGESQNSAITTPTSVPATGTFFDGTSVIVTAGDWDIGIVVELVSNGSTFTSTDFQVGIGTVAGNDDTGLHDGDTSVQLAGDVPTTFSKTFLSVPTRRFSISSTTTYYAKIFVDAYNAGTPKYTCRLTARRVR